MGKVHELVLEMREKPSQELLDRYKKCVCVWAVRDYLSAEPLADLNVEIREIEDEIFRRINNRLRFEK